MKRLFLHKLTLSGHNKPNAEIIFKEGLNLVSGASDTGKTLIFQCIYYMLGSDEKPKVIPESDGYTTLSLEYGDETRAYYLLQRSINGGDFLVKNLLNSAAAPQTLKRNNIYDLLADHLGLNGKKLKKNQNNETVKLGFPAVRKFLLVDEQHIISESSPIFGANPSKKSEEKSAFKFVLSGMDDSDLIVSGDTSNEKLKKIGKKSAFNEMIQSLKARVGKTNAAEIVTQKEKLDLAIQNCLEELSSINLQAAAKLERRIRNQELIDKILHRQRSIGINRDRFNLLLATYRSDIDRINFVIEGKGLFDQLNVGNCPYCGHKMDHVHKDSTIETLDLDSLVAASKAEIEKIRNLMFDLESTIRDLTDENKELQRNHDDLKDQNTQIENQIKSSLAQKTDELKKRLQELSSKRDELNEITLFHNELINLEKLKDESLQTLTDTEEKQPEQFNQDLLLGELCKEIEKLLVEWQISKEPRVTFNLEQYDVVIDGKARRSFGKGFRAILYTAFLVALHNLGQRRKTFSPGLIIIDSPLTTHEEADEVDTGIQESFFNSVSKIRNLQTIILDNKMPPESLIPKINYYHYSAIKGAKDQGFIPGF